MQTKEVTELSKQIRQKMKDIDAFGKSGCLCFLCVPSWPQLQQPTVKKFVSTHMICSLYMLNAVWGLTCLLAFFFLLLP